MIRRAFLSLIPKALAASGTAMFLVGKGIDRQETLSVIAPETELTVWRFRFLDFVQYDAFDTYPVDGGFRCRHWTDDAGEFRFIKQSANAYRFTCVKVKRLNPDEILVYDYPDFWPGFGISKLDSRRLALTPIQTRGRIYC